jgi:hypothetical protein
MKVTVYNSHRNKSWVISPKSISEHEYLSKYINLPIEIYVCDLTKRKIWGDFCVRKSLITRRPINVIRLEQSIPTAEEANGVLWHELCHVVQCEQFPAWEFYWLDYVFKGGNYDHGGDYQNNPYEIDAREFSDYFAPHVTIAYRKEK